MIKELLKYAKKPNPYEPSTSKFWDDEHISKGMLEAHTNLDSDVATRNRQFLDESVHWITTIASPSTHKKLLDFGCGPGLYCERFYQKGYHVTGLDFSKRSIEYAINQAMTNKFDINYIFTNYLEFESDQLFDVITLIYCDYSVLSKENRMIMLKKIHNLLVEGGKFIFDVFTPFQYLNREESSSWYVSSSTGFWKEGAHASLENHYIYDNQLRLDQYIVIDQNNHIDVYRIWDQAFTVDSIKAELAEAGFKKVDIYSDLCGITYYPESKTMAIVVTK
ncbi:MAG: class I SAM-dependent methyltransferase [Tenericutes bacterium HGW-Tenericutes-1]|jgi:SAM-dependent methyltransferase|nr:MAG: class I SAM-dependent methyltransferase [Tenericutes bacterium HGW-Tenericutes-1]